METGNTEAIYDNAHAGGVASLVVAGVLSGLAVLTVFVAVSIRSPSYQNTHVVPYFVSLLVANVLQALGTCMNAKWVIEHTVEAGPFCSFQGAIKQVGNVGMALWSFVLASHLFSLLFLRRKSTQRGLLMTLIGGWSVIIFIVAIGPIAIQTTKKRGPYFGPSGYWCWITSSYPHEQIFMEYFFEFLSAFLSFVLYTGILLCVRGNLIKSGGRWRLRFVPNGESWQLSISRDRIDSAMVAVAVRMVWYPVTYSVLLLPASLARLIEFGGHNVPFWATMLADFIFNLQGFVNVVVLLSTRRFIPDTATLPIFSTPRKEIDFTSPEAIGITPFILPPKPEPAQLERAETVVSVDSTTPMVPKPRFSMLRPMSWRR
ncbi:hypothetical protein QCA50_013845 [Cerrena zonata]|uniref:Glucose receptor Git3 N-terminal domain-containing protein n=1 Tax=Cerrena zonata TaxID=2478898 RepID=A0AAW0G0T7_9APHY